MNIERGATFTKPGFRTVLRRNWGDQNDLDKPCGVFIGLNPGLADDKRDDATARKYVGFGSRWGWRGYIALNLFDYVATTPTDLYLRIFNSQEVCTDRDYTALQLCIPVKPPVCLASGNAPGNKIVRAAWLERVERVLNILADAGIEPICAAVTKDGWPAHLSRLPYVESPRPWKRA